ncbi:preprotein translocase subunit YajC [Parvibium lacunae]|uniref:Sec translocon accessory complex subunit YajC n=1 Tax=Parvibium lacunae TaxID=1888893 RepID=A0A368L1T9_9BURK|nr:preprotein translocase subunit YajC [Parvibium lacunae]RCS57443.1 preprotein translocase subunit YajC [Parvibium lacunae]
MFISNAYAQAAGASGAGSTLGQFLPLILMFILLYFLMIRPQMKKAKEQRAMIEALAKGDEVITVGGILGKITQVDEAYINVEVAKANGQAIEMTLQKGAVQTVLPKGTLKQASK